MKIKLLICVVFLGFFFFIGMSENLTKFFISDYNYNIPSDSISKENIEEEIKNEDNNQEIMKKNKKVCIDPGHQRKGNNQLEEIAPGSAIKKPKVSSGTRGVSTKKYEYELTLEIGLKLKNILEDNGYEVFMTRDIHDVNISNKERSLLVNASGCSLYIRVHADGSTNKNIQGISMQTSSNKNNYTKHIQKANEYISEIILSEVLKTTQAKNRGINYRDDLSGTNWSQIPNTLIEIGFMSNVEEDKLLSTTEYQDKLVKGIFNGIEKYFLSN